MNTRLRPAVVPSLMAPLTLGIVLAIDFLAVADETSGGAVQPTARRVLAEPTLYAGRTAKEWQAAIKTLDYDSPERSEYVSGLTAMMNDAALVDHQRRLAAITLGRIGRPARSAIPDLIEHLSDNSTALWASKGLARFGPEGASAAEALLKVLGDQARPVAVRQSTLEPLSLIGPTRKGVLGGFADVIEELEPTGREESFERQNFRILAIESLLPFGPAATPLVPTLLRRLQAGGERERVAVLQVMQGIGPGALPAATTFIDHLLFDPSDTVRDNARDALVTLGSPAIRIFRRLADDRDPEVRRRVIEGLGQIGTRARSAAKAIEKRLTDQSSEVRRVALVSLWQTTRSKERVWPHVVVEIASDARQNRKSAVDLLSELPAATPTEWNTLQELSTDPRPEVRSAAKQALRKWRLAE